MRKVTGYIGALIIVMALMGSILAGYALNINGQSVVVNEYEKVTDVSGLYSHTDQKTYIDYNPASNYIGYQNSILSFDNPTTTNTFKKIGSENVKINTSGHTFINNVDQGIGVYPYFCVITDTFYIYVESGTYVTYYDTSGRIIQATQDITITVGTSNTTVTVNGTSYTHNINIYLAYCTNQPDYYGGRVNSQFDVYLNDKKNIVGLTDTPLALYYNGELKGVRSDAGNNTNIEWLGTGTGIDYGVTQYTIEPTVNSNHMWTIFYPISVDSATVMGINYTESNRVNNYPVGSDTVNYDIISYKTVDLQALSTTNYATANSDWVIGTLNNSLGGHSVVQRIYAPNYDNNGVRQNTIFVYKLSDVLSTVTLPANTREIIIDLGARNITTPISWHLPEVNNGTFTFSSQIKNNFTFINTFNYTYNYPAMSSAAYETGMTYHYFPDTNMVYWYDYNGTSVGSSNVNDTYVQFVSAATSYGKIEYNYDGNPTRTAYYQQDSTRPHPYLNLTIRSSNTLITPHYMDITKGISIKGSNISDTIWNNEYENGQIDLLFRAEDAGWTYHNDFTVAGNDISVDYAAGRFSVALNGDTPVDVGTWRAIVLHIDLQNGKLSVRPVRTFNSYSNVILDTASIEVGDLVGAAPTNIITWDPTAASFTFSVYRTSVFMDTYGVVMVNPTLNITDYFPNLDNFYRLDLYNFSLYGDSITVNGQTGTVTDNTVTFGDDSFILKDFSVIYADGHAYIEDSHVSVDLGVITDNTVSLSGVWYFQTELLSGYTAEKQIYTWDWSSFIFDNVQFCIFYIGLAFAGLVIARHFCIMSITDYAVFIASIIIALGVQVIA